jgi:hypothetical protein
MLSARKFIKEGFGWFNLFKSNWAQAFAWDESFWWYGIVLGDELI